MTYIFGVFEFDAASLELRKSGRFVALEPQPARALSLLVERAGQTVTREELSAWVWGTDTYVDFNRGLAYCIGQVRAALGDSGENPRFIQTLPRRGFKFIAPVTVHGAAEPARSVPTPPLASAPGTAHWRRMGLGIAGVLVVVFAATFFGERVVQRGRRPVVAVSIFDNETGDSRYDRAVHALADSVVERLTGLGPAQVGIVGNAAILRMPRSRRDLDRIEAETGASHVVLAQLQPSKGELTLLMHLIRLDDGTHLWTRRIPRPAADSLEGLDAEAATMIESGVRQYVLAPNSY